MIEGFWAWVGDPGTVVGRRGIPHPREIDETYTGDDGRRRSGTA